ncbi:MAG: ABC transporter permease [Cytophagales bacterium]|nr:ABC transporter permease [Cytophagales bacterium]
MDNHNKSNRPAWADNLLRWLCNPAYLEEIEGDLREAFEDRLKKHKPWVARLYHLMDVFSFLRPSLLKNPFSQLNINHAVMLRNHFKVSRRVLLKNKLFSLINIVGLAIGITAYVLIIQYVKFEFSYDQHHPRVDDLYRVTLTTNLGEKGFITSATNHPAVAPAMKADFPEVENYTRLFEQSIWGTFVLSSTDNSGEVMKLNAKDEHVLIADNSVLSLFAVSLLQGNPETALKDPQSIVLSASFADRFFGGEDPMGKTISINNKFPLKVTGIFEDLPQNTHIHFDILVPLSFMDEDWLRNMWKWPEFYNYIRLKPGTNPGTLEAKFPAFIKKYLGELMSEHGFEAKFELQPVKDIHLKSHLHKEISANSSDRTLYFLIIISGFVILIALINFINLSTAKSVERAKEVGLRKVVGVSRGALIGQFLLESMMINCISIILSIGLVSLLINPFNHLVGLNVLSLSMWTEPALWLTLLLIFLSGGILAGIYPAFVLSGYKPVYVLKGKIHQTGQGVLLRKILVVAQFSISITLIVGTFIVYSQFSYMQNQELGFDAAHNVVVNAPTVVDSTINHKIEVFKSELLRSAHINAVTVTDNIPGKRITLSNTIRKQHEAKEKGVVCYYVNIDHNFLDAYQIDLLAGRNFTIEDRSSYGRRNTNETEQHRVMINKAAAIAMGFPEPEKALNEKIIFKVWGTMDGTAEVIGIVDNHHQQSLQKDLDPVIFLYPDYYTGMYMTVSINTRNTIATMDFIGKQFSEFFPHDPYKYFFLDEYFNRQYRADRQFGQICLLFSGLAIFIAALGLFGLGSFMALQKIREISVRKVLGASLMQVVVLLPRQLLKLIIISGVIALPIAYIMVDKWLSDFAFRIDMDWWMFMFPLLIVFMVAILSVLFQSIKAGLINPADSLKSE